MTTDRDTRHDLARAYWHVMNAQKRYQPNQAVASALRRAEAALQDASAAIMREQTEAPL